jgi:hypothetical protein
MLSFDWDEGNHCMNFLSSSIFGQDGGNHFMNFLSPPVLLNFITLKWGQSMCLRYKGWHPFCIQCKVGLSTVLEYSKISFVSILGIPSPIGKLYLERIYFLRINLEQNHQL